MKMDTIVLILLLIYVLIILISILEVTSLSVAALVGALLVAWFGIQYGAFTYQDALGFVDFRLLGLLIGNFLVETLEGCLLPSASLPLLFQCF
jgi:Na+/H+ antiporter NhaD/arsenite permease-like protein